MKNFIQLVRQFKEDEDGAGTSFAIIWAILCISIGGIAVDASHVWAMESRLQATADVAAHAGIMVLVHPDRFDSSETAVANAVASAAQNMSVDSYGTVLVAADVVVGRWDSGTETMDTSGLVASDAVAVTTRLDGVNSNVVPTFLLRLIGFNYWEVSTSAVFQRILPNCHFDGLMAAGTVDMTSNNNFFNNFCIHGHDGVELNNGNLFEEGVKITMANPALVDDGGTFNPPESNTNIGMWEALGASPLMPELSKNDSIDDIHAQLLDPASSIQKPYITDNLGTNPDPATLAANVTPTTVVISAPGVEPVITQAIADSYTITLDVHNPFDASMLVANKVNVIECGNGVASKITFANTTVVENVVIIADCEIQFGTDMRITDAVIFTSDTSSDSMKGAEGVKLGVDDGCIPGGGAQFITKGDVNFASGMEYYGSQIIANGDVQLAAAAQGIEGLSIQSSGNITVTANNVMGLCGGGVDTIQDQYWYRMVY